MHQCALYNPKYGIALLLFTQVYECLTPLSTIFQVTLCPQVILLEETGIPGANLLKEGILWNCL
jgi:hypothetical protein